LAYNAERVVAEKLGRETVTYCQQHTSSTWRDLERAFRTKGVCAGHAFWCSTLSARWCLLSAAKRRGQGTCW